MAHRAEIVVGQNVPFIASTSSSETNLGNTFNTVERHDVGITLRLTPQISAGGMVRLDIFEEVSALTQNSLIDPEQLGPVTTIRSATTSVVVRDQHDGAGVVEAIRAGLLHESSFVSAHGTILFSRRCTDASSACAPGPAFV